MPAASPTTIADLSALVALATTVGRREHVPFMRRGYIAGVANNLAAVGARASMWLLDGQPGTSATAPSTAAVCTNATPGGLMQATPTLGYRKLLTRFALTARITGTWYLYDRLCHQGGLSATTTGAQTTNLPTAALTRRTDGVGVEPWLEIYSAIGSTGTTALASYTNDAGTGGSTSGAVTFGSTGFSGKTQHMILPLAAGDRGCRAVASVTLAASTLTAGNFGVTLAYPLIVYPTYASVSNVPANLIAQGGLIDLGVNSDACIAFGYTTSVVSVLEAVGGVWFLEAP